jgi:hypothetical protein
MWVVKPFARRQLADPRLNAHKKEKEEKSTIVYAKPRNTQSLKEPKTSYG